MYIQNLAIFWALVYLELKVHETREILTRHIRNLSIGHQSAIFRLIQNFAQHLHTQKPGILGILEYSEPFHNCNPTHIQNSVIFTKIYEYSKLGTYAEPFKRFKMDSFAKILKNYIYFSKAFHLRSLTRFWIHISLNKYSLSSRVTSHCVLHDTYLEPCLLL